MSSRDLAAERPSESADDVHFTHALARAVIGEFSSSGEVVLDPFAGYGTTLIISEQLGRTAVGIELLPERVALIKGRVGAATRVHTGDARDLDQMEIGPVDLCLTSPPYMSSVDHPQNPLTAYTSMDGNYPSYLHDLQAIFLAVKRRLRPGGHLVINAATIRTGDIVTPLAWDLVRELAGHLTFRGETYLRWDQPPPHINGDYCLVFRKDR
jgi:DNA modification methylase